MKKLFTLVLVFGMIVLTIVAATTGLATHAKKELRTMNLEFNDSCEFKDDPRVCLYGTEYTDGSYEIYIDLGRTYTVKTYVKKDNSGFYEICQHVIWNGQNYDIVRVKTVFQDMTKESDYLAEKLNREVLHYLEMLDFEEGRA